MIWKNILKDFTNTFIVFDIETDGLYDEVSLLHCFSYAIYKNKKIIEKKSLVSYTDILDFIKLHKNDIFVGHSIVTYDIPVLEKLLNTSLNDLKVIDTLGISWGLFINNKKHSLEDWGKKFGVNKIEIKDWKNLSIEEYILRCETDVEITVELFKYLMNYLHVIYDGSDKMFEYISYLNFKLECLKEQEMYKIPIDIPLVNTHLKNFKKIYNEKYELLSDMMPLTLSKKVCKIPKNMYNAKNEMTVNALKYLDKLETGLYVIDEGYLKEKPNPSSPAQLKDWLLSLGWKPEIFKLGTKNNKIPQISKPFGDGLCDSIKKMFDEHSFLTELENFYVIKHRIGVLESYLETQADQNIVSTAHGFTNTLRLKHVKPTANIPRPTTKYGKECREVWSVKSKEDLMYGVDIAALEDSTKQHYIYEFDPEYVKDMRVEGFDPHIDIGVVANMITKEEAELFKNIDFYKKDFASLEEKELFKNIKDTRLVTKRVNFSAMYGAGILKLMEATKKSYEECQELHIAYWKRNAAIKKSTAKTKIKTVCFFDGTQQDFLLNPISGFWIFLKNKKDVFSTKNQNSGVYVFDTLLSIVRKKLPVPIRFQYHDEFMYICKIWLENEVDLILTESVEILNEVLKLNVPISISISKGSNYANVH